MLPNIPISSLLLLTLLNGWGYVLGGVMGGDNLICSSIMEGVRVQNESVLKLYSLNGASN